MAQTITDDEVAGVIKALGRITNVMAGQETQMIQMTQAHQQEITEKDEVISSQAARIDQLEAEIRDLKGEDPEPAAEVDPSSNGTEPT